MRPQDWFALFSSAAMWGASFIFARALVPVIGLAWMADLRVLVGGSFVALILWWRREPLNVLSDFKHYALLGLINCALPFALFAFAALHIPAAYLAIGNATAPLWSAVLGMLWFQEALNGRKIIGLMLGVVGVALTAKAGATAMDPIKLMAFFGTIGASLLYALAGAYMRTHAKHIQTLPMACGSQLAAVLWLLPLLPFFPANTGAIDLNVVLLVLGAGVISTGLPYVVYFPLMRRIGVTKAMTVTFLVPCFAFLFGFVFLAERVSWSTMLGCGFVIAGLVLILRAKA